MKLFPSQWTKYRKVSETCILHFSRNVWSAFFEVDKTIWASLVAQLVKNPPAMLGSIPGSGRFSGEGHGNPLQYSFLENPMHRVAWRVIVHGIVESDTTEAALHA